MLSQLWPLGGGRRPNYAPVKVVGVTVGQERGDGFSYFLVGQNVPESVRPHDQDVVGSVLVVRQVVNFHLKQERELAVHTRFCYIKLAVEALVQPRCYLSTILAWNRKQFVCV